MAILVNIEPAHECFEPMQQGMEAAQAEIPTSQNPYRNEPCSREYALWLIGYMAQKHSWDVEW